MLPARRTVLRSSLRQRRSGARSEAASIPASATVETTSASARSSMPGGAEDVDLARQHARVPEDREADDDQQELEDDVGRGQRHQPSLTPVPGEADDVDRADEDDDPDRDRDRRGPAGEGARERVEVVRDGDRREGDHDHVVDQDRPPGDEADQLVEGVAGERVGAAALAEHRPALDVGHRRDHVDEPGDGEHHRGQREPMVRHHAERVVDREGDRRMRDRPQPRHPEEPPAERRLPAPPLRHRAFRVER